MFQSKPRVLSSSKGRLTVHGPQHCPHRHGRTSPLATSTPTPLLGGIAHGRLTSSTPLEPPLLRCPTCQNQTPFLQTSTVEGQQLLKGQTACKDTLGAREGANLSVCHPRVLLWHGTSVRKLLLHPEATRKTGVTNLPNINHNAFYSRALQSY